MAAEQKEAKRRINISVTAERYEKIKAEAEKKGISIPAWINLAITAQLPKKKC